MEFTFSKLIFRTLLLTLGLPVSAQVLTVEAMYVDSFAFASPLVDSEGVPLVAGLEENGDGAIIQIGYFAGVAADPAGFDADDWMTFAPLTGIGSPNAERFPTSIGDADAPATGPFGFFFLPAPFAIQLDPAIDQGLPLAYPARLGIRFFDGTTLENSTSYNTVSSNDPMWLLQSAGGGAILDMDGDELFWQSGLTGTFQTSMSYIPEPGSGVLVFLVGTLMIIWRKRS